jgi:PAS domain-containing protein
MFLRREFSPGFSRAVNRLLRSRSGVRHATGTPPSPDPATTMEKLDAALNNMSHGLCMFGPDNRLLLWNDRYVKCTSWRLTACASVRARRNARGAPMESDPGSEFLV